jgi:Flp pilus assembly protein TadB
MRLTPRRPIDRQREQQFIRQKNSPAEAGLNHPATAVLLLGRLCWLLVTLLAALSRSLGLLAGLLVLVALLLLAGLVLWCLV